MSGVNEKLLEVALNGLRRFGGPADRAREMLEESIALVNEERARAPELAAYSLRECLEQIPPLFGVPPRDFDLETPVRDFLSEFVVTEDARGGNHVDTGRAQEILELLSRRETTRAQRVAEAMASQLPIETQTDDFVAFARDWAALVDILNSIVHEDSPHRAEIADLVETGVRLVAAIAGAMSERLERVDQILAVSGLPTGEVVEEALALTADPRLSVYFYSRLEFPDWLDPLRSKGVFDSPGTRYWYQGAYLKRVAAARPDDVLEIVLTVVRSGDPFGDLALGVASDIGPAALPLVQRVLERTTGHEFLGFAFIELVEKWAASGHTAMMPTLADVSLNLALDDQSRRPRGKFSDHEMNRVVSGIVGLCDPGSLKELAQVLVWKIEKVFRAAREAEYRMFSLDRQTVYAGGDDTFGERPMSALIDGLRDTLTRMRTAGFSLEVRCELMDQEYELFARIWQNHLAEAPDEDLETSCSLLAEAMTSWATPESLRLLREAWPFLDGSARSKLLEAHGDPALADRAADWQSDEDLHRELLRMRQWLVATGDAAPEEWKRAFEKLVEEFGSPDPEAAAFRMEFFAGSPSPLEADEVDSLGPQGLVEWISNWKPEDGIRSATPEMLGRAIAEAVGRDVMKWTIDLPSTLEGLKEPVYIRGVFAGLTEAAKESHLADEELEPIVMAAELVWTEPWQSALELRDTFDFDPDWTRTRQQVVDLFVELARKDGKVAPYVDRIAAMLEQECWKTESTIGVTPADPFTSALNKANTQALRALIDLALHAYRHKLGDAWSHTIFGIIEAQLSGDADENSLAVAALAAVYWTQLLLLDDERAEGLRDLVFGPPHTEGLKTVVLESSIKYSRPTKRLLGGLKEHLLLYLAQVGVEVDNDGQSQAITWLLLGYLWEVEGWLNLDELLAFLLQIEQLSHAAGDYGRILKNTDPLPEELQQRAVEFWESALNTGAEPVQYRGFGWWSETALPDETWLPLIRRTLDLSQGGVDWLDGLIERLSRLTHDIRAVEALEVVLSGPDKDPWAFRLVEKQILAALEAARDAHGKTPVFQRIVELLLERELYQFRKFLVDQGPTEGGGSERS